MPFVDIPPQLQERVVCSISAAVKYEVPANIVLAVAEKEGGKPGQRVLNANGSHDVGPMQFNTNYLRDLGRYGITENDVAIAGCYSYDLAAWRLRGHIKKDKGDLWTRVANYHSRTPQFNAVYRADLCIKATKWADWLEARFVTVDVTKTGIAPTTTAVAPITELPAQAVVEKPVTKVSLNNSGYVSRKLIINGQP